MPFPVPWCIILLKSTGKAGATISDVIHVDQIHLVMKANDAEFATDPVFCTLRSDTKRFDAIVKLFNNRQGNLSLVNEWCAAQMCQALGLSLPQSGICNVDQTTIVADEIKQDIPCFSSKNYGPAFYSSYRSGAIPASAKLFGHVDVQQLANMMLFDHLIYNKDRHNGNLMFEVGKGFTFFLIDHSHIFKNDCIWTGETFRRGIEEDDYLDESIYDANRDVYRKIMLYAHPNRQNFEDACKSFQDELTPEVIHSIISRVPTAWISSVESDVPMLEAYINYRTAHLRAITELILRKGGL